MLPESRISTGSGWSAGSSASEKGRYVVNPAYPRRPGDADAAARFDARAAARRQALVAAAYDQEAGYFYDVRWRTGDRVTDRPTMAAAAALYFGLASPEQGRAVAGRLERQFLAPGGFATTRVASGQQWDAPNGWAPLEWMAIEGVRRYGRGDLADVARTRWLALLRHTYESTGRMMEKYDVEDLTRKAGGGEYPAQDGFGWTNGVALALAAETRQGQPAAPDLVGAGALAAATQRQARPSLAASSPSNCHSVQVLPSSRRYGIAGALAGRARSRAGFRPCRQHDRVTEPLLHRSSDV